jgi:hypothetical protein
MGQRKKRREDRCIHSSGSSATRAEVHASFRAMVKSLRCPNCELEFTDFALDWGDAWCEGRRDSELELGHPEGSRDGPYKLKCELCGHRAWLNYFTCLVSSAEPHDAEPDAPPETLK